MSIINDALRKTQKEFQASKPIINSEKPKRQPSSLIKEEKSVDTAQTPALKESEKKSFMTIFLIFIVFITAGLIVYLFSILQNRQTPKNTTIASLSTPQQTTSTQATAPSTTRNSTLSTGNKIILNGTMTMKNRKAALINNEIYEMGEYINGWKIVSIDFDTVKLSKKNEKLILKTNRKQ
jgi:hypothetical protein